jgi:pimeloyl-ACP methyl ester carboxylesterase
LVVAGRRATGRRFTLLVPRHTTGPVPLLVAFHGKGETVDETMGVRAWLDRYGLGSSYARLLATPVVAIDKKATHWTAARLAAVNEELLLRPFGGLAVACPFTPDVFKLGGRGALLDDYARWVTDEVVPRARRETAILEGERHVGVDGVSLGGFVSLEVFLRRPERFGAWGSVQGALGGMGPGRYARAIAAALERVGPRKLHLETSLGDVYRVDTEGLSRALTKLAVAHDFVAPPGWHNQPFLRDSGTLEMLLWHDRALRA